VFNLFIYLFFNIHLRARLRRKDEEKETNKINLLLRKIL